MNKVKQFFQKLLPSKRKLIQLYSALLFNANLKGFVNGEIYKGPLKNICTPGLNCYSCPGAAGACPLGSLQNALGQSEKRTPFYVFGILLLYGILLGRFICGFLCPFGLIQDLLHKIKTPKIRKSRVTRIFSYFKYVILVLFVFIIPILYGIRNVPLPAFCKYICPAGTVEGAFGLLSNKVNESMLSMLGPLFTWKFVLTVSFIVGAIFLYRFFCRFFCPLGALYGLFNKISFFGIKLEKPKCTNCGLCHTKCKMDIRQVGDHECISCGECIDVCPTKAISWKGSKVMLAPNEIDLPDDASEEEREAAEKELAIKQQKIAKRNKILKITVITVMTLLLAFALIYFNVIDNPKAPTTTDVTTGIEDPSQPSIGNDVGDRCYGEDLPVFDENGLSGTTFNPAENFGKVTVINFWGVWCGGCVKELPYFDDIATRYSDSVTVVAVHTDLDFDEGPDYVNTNYKESLIIFLKDSADDRYYTLLGGNDNWPITLILDENGIVTDVFLRDVKQQELEDAVLKALAATKK